MTNKCPICSATKGKRGCLLHNQQLICSPCCAKTRNPDCDGCSYYSEAQHYSTTKAKKAVKPLTIRIDEAVNTEINRGLEMLDTGKLAEGESVLTALAQESKNDDLCTLHFALGVLYIRKEQYEEAIASFDRAIAIYPHYVDAWFNKALAAQNNLDVLLMINALKRVLAIGDPNQAITLQAKEFLTAIEQRCGQDAGIDLDTYVQSLECFKQGVALMQTRQWQAALLAFEQGVALNANDVPALSNMAMCYMQLNESATAMTLFDQALAIDPEYEVALTQRELVKSSMQQQLTESTGWFAKLSKWLR